MSDEPQDLTEAGYDGLNAIAGSLDDIAQALHANTGGNSIASVLEVALAAEPGERTVTNALFEIAIQQAKIGYALDLIAHQFARYNNGLGYKK
jgi:hypothetical protein